jgi:hypothetical protein
MNTFLAASDVALTFPLLDSQGQTLSPTAASYRVFDENDVALCDVTLIDPVVDPLTVTVSALLNTLPDYSARGYRRCEVTVTTMAGIVALVPQEYLVQPTETARLIPGTNSYQTIRRAELEALDIPGLDGWQGATSDQRIAAMIQARKNLGQIRYRYHHFLNRQSVIFPEFAAYSINQLTQTQYWTLPLDFRVALERAQIMEADDLIGGDPATEARRLGIVSETIGGSTTMYSQNRPIRRIACEKAMKEIARFTVNHIRLSRV